MGGGHTFGGWIVLVSGAWLRRTLWAKWGELGECAALMVAGPAFLTGFTLQPRRHGSCLKGGDKIRTRLNRVEVDPGS